jgi:hypothetical protein
MSEGKTTTDHDEIRQWAEERGGVPASVKGTGGGKKGRGDEAGILRLDFEPRDEALEEISWEEFFEKFDKEKLAFLYQDETSDGSTSRFHKFIDRSSAGKSASSGKSGGAKSGGSSKSAGGKSESGSKSTAKSSGGTKSASAGKSGGGAKSSGSGKSSGGAKKTAAASK